MIPILLTLGASGTLAAWLLYHAWRAIHRPRCEGCGALLPPELVDAQACWACLGAAVARIAALPDWRTLDPRSDTPDADRLLRQLDE